MMKTWQEVQSLTANSTKSSTGDLVATTSVTLMDLLHSIPAQTVIVKLDIEGFECKVGVMRQLLRQLLLSIVLFLQICLICIL